MMRTTNAEAKAHAARVAAEPVPEFEFLDFRQAQEFLKPYYNGKPPSTATLERRVADGTIVAAQDRESRTGPKRILKASLISWMRKLGKQFQEDFQD